MKNIRFQYLGMAFGFWIQLTGVDPAQAQEQLAVKIQVPGEPSWMLGKDGTLHDEVTDEDWQKVVNYLSSDSRGMEILQNAVGRAGVASIHDLYKVIGVLNPSYPTDANTGGQSIQPVYFTRPIQDVIQTASVEEDPPSLENALNTQYAANIAEFRRDPKANDENGKPVVIPENAPGILIPGKDVFQYRAQVTPEKVCIKRDVGVSAVAQIAVHEFIHYIHRDLLNTPARDMTQYKDEEDYLHHVVNEKGDEVDAYIEEFGYLIRESKKKGIPKDQALKSDVAISNPILPTLFREDGSFISLDSDRDKDPNRAKLADFILDRFDHGLYRKTRFHNDYNNQLHDAFESTGRAIRVYQNAFNLRAQEEHNFVQSYNHAVQAQNPEAIEHYKNIILKIRESADRIKAEITRLREYQDQVAKKVEAYNSKIEATRITPPLPSGEPQSR